MDDICQFTDDLLARIFQDCHIDDVFSLGILNKRFIKFYESVQYRQIFHYRLSSCKLITDQFSLFQLAILCRNTEYYIELEKSSDNEKYNFKQEYQDVIMETRFYVSTKFSLYYYCLYLTKSGKIICNSYGSEYQKTDLNPILPLPYLMESDELDNVIYIEDLYDGFKLSKANGEVLIVEHRYDGTWNITEIQTNSLIINI